VRIVENNGKTSSAEAKTGNRLYSSGLIRRKRYWCAQTSVDSCTAIAASEPREFVKANFLLMTTDELDIIAFCWGIGPVRDADVWNHGVST
jgi:hypothetical protein